MAGKMEVFLVAASFLATLSTSTGMSCYVQDSGAPMLGMDHALGSESPKLRAPLQTVLEEMADVNVKVRAASGVAQALDPVSVPVHFVLRDVKDIEDVTVVGSWTKWSEHFKLLKKDSEFAGWVDVPVGTHQFKFITDGNWITSDEFPIETDEAGNTNNILRVTAEPAGPHATAEAHAPSETLISAQRTPSPTTGAGQDGGQLAHALSAALSPIQTGLRFLFAPFRFLLRLVGLV